MKHNTAAIKALLDTNNGGFVTITFTKKDGSVRNINGRPGVLKYLQGGVRTTNPNEFYILYENNNGYRNIRLDSISVIKMDGVTYNINQ